MLHKNNLLKIEVLVNSHGPHEQVRIREPFSALQRIGVDCRMFRFPFDLNKAIRPNSLVIWQRPRPTSWEEQLFIIRWIRNNQSILLTEWDDHPNLFPIEIQTALNKISMAPLKLCHALHTSSNILAKSLNKIQPISYVVPNAIWRIPKININKHISAKGGFRIFVGNQNRLLEHQQLITPLREWCLSQREVKVVIIGDKNLANSLPTENIERYPLLKYLDYRKIMRSCHIALMPLEDNLPNNCKTEIKWMEAAAESVASIGGPGLYKRAFENNHHGIYCEQINQLIPLAKSLKSNLNKRLNIISSAHSEIKKNSNLRELLPERLKLYQSIWNRRQELDEMLLQRFPEIAIKD